MVDPPVAIVTGASRGIGRAIAIALARAGHPVGLVARGRSDLEATLALVRAEAGDDVEATVAPADLASWDAVDDVCARVEDALGPVGVLVNNAGTAGADIPFVDTDPEAWERVVRTNLLAPMWLCRRLVPGMVERGRGIVVNLNSLGGTRPFPTASAYAASKAGLCRLTDTLAEELEGVVQVFDVSPGLVRTSMTDGLAMWADVPDDVWSPPEAAGDVVARLASGRYGALSGRFVHAPSDDLDALAAAVADDPEARTLRLTLTGSDDPLAS